MDVHWFESRGIAIATGSVDIDDLPYCNPADHLLGRLLIKYVREEEAEKFSVIKGVSTYSGPHYLTPTPIASGDLIPHLALPPMAAPSWALLLLPEKLDGVRGPRMVKAGGGIEYIAENGFTSEAFAQPWPIQYR